jgi:hypothetical protein
MTNTPDDFERQLSARLRSAADGAPRPPSGMGHIDRRIAQRRRRRDQIRMGTGAAAIAVVAGVVGGTLATRGRTSNLSPAASASSALTTVAASATLKPGSQSSTTNATKPATKPAANLSWPRYIGPDNSAWTLKTATSWNAVRTGVGAWPVRYNRSSTWSNGTHSVNGPFVVIQTEVAAPPTNATSGQAGARQVKIREQRSDATEVWFTEDVNGKLWTTVMHGRGISSAALLDIVAGAQWNVNDELWDLPTAPEGWSRDRWPNVGEPRELLLSFGRADGATLDVFLANTPARLGATAITLGDAAPGSAAGVTTVRGHQANVYKVGDTVTVLWPETEMIVGEARATRVSPDELVALLNDVAAAAVEPNLQRL